ATREYGVGRSAGAESQSAAERHSARADHWVPSPIAQNAARPGEELSEADGDHARRIAGHGDDGPSTGPTAAHRASTGSTDPATRTASAAGDAAARAACRRPNAGARPGRRYPRPRQSAERLRTAHRDHSQRQDRETQRVRQTGHHSRIGTSDHY